MTGIGGANTFFGFEIRGLGLFLGYQFSVGLFFDIKIFPRTFFRVDKNDILPFSILCELLGGLVIA